MTRLDDDRALGLHDAIHTDGPHPVDDFVDPALSRHRTGWTPDQVPEHLRDLADSVWSALGDVADGHDAAPALDAARTAYDLTYRTAQQLTHDTTVATRVAARRAGARAERKRARAEPLEPPARRWWSSRT